MNPAATNPLLANLRDIEMPAAISAWPPAWGWWLVAALIIAGVLLATLAYRKYRTERPWRAALSHIARLNQDTQGAALITLLKQWSIQHGAPPSIHGAAWVAWCEGQSWPMSAALKAWLSEGYLRRETVPAEWHEVCRAWFKR